jgi:hypothetical protein
MIVKNKFNFKDSNEVLEKIQNVHLIWPKDSQPSNEA